MIGSPLAKAALSAVVVGLLLTLLRRASPRAAGLAAAVPVSSMPALFWLSMDHGSAYASTAALGSLWGTGLTALLGVVFARSAQRCHAALAALLAWLAIAALAALTWPLPAMLTLITGLALAVVLGGQAVPANTTAVASPRRRPMAEALLSMAVAGVMSVATSELSRVGAPQLCGLIATIPVVGMSTVYAAHRHGGTPVMLRVVDGYLDGMLAKAAFLGALYLAWGAGSSGWAWILAFAGGGLALAAQRSIRSVRARFGTVRPPSGERVVGGTPAGRARNARPLGEPAG